MQHYAEISLNIENSTCVPLKFTMGSLILIVSICMGRSIRIQRENGITFESTEVLSRIFIMICKDLYLTGLDN